MAILSHISDINVPKWLSVAMPMNPILLLCEINRIQLRLITPRSSISQILNRKEIFVFYSVVDINLCYPPTWIWIWCVYIQNIPLIETAIENSITDPGLHEFAGREIYFSLHKEQDHTVYDSTIHWLHFVHIRTKQFFDHINILPPSSRTWGNYTVLITHAEYNSKVFEHLNRGAYKPVTNNPLVELIETEGKFIKILSNKPIT